MNKRVGFLVAWALSLSAQQGMGPIQRSLDSMQQLRSLIPERNWEQVFNINIHHDAFDKQFESSTTFQATPSQGYFLFATTSGEAIRILDLYEQFQFSPYWHIPELLEDLRETERSGIETDILMGEGSDDVP